MIKNDEPVKLNIAGRELYVTFNSNLVRIGKPKRSGKKLYWQVITIAIIRTYDPFQTFTGVAVCNEMDVPHDHIGRKIAFDRAIAAMIDDHFLKLSGNGLIESARRIHKAARKALWEVEHPETVEMLKEQEITRELAREEKRVKAAEPVDPVPAELIGALDELLRTRLIIVPAG